MKLLLTSNGIASELKDVFLKLLSKDPKEIKLSFITTSAYGEDDDVSWLEGYRQQLREFGITQIENFDLKDKTQEEVKSALERTDIIFMNGGNTYYLLKYVRESGFDKLLPNLLENGKLYVGVSAGSIILGPSIEFVNWQVGIPDTNKVQLSDFTGLNIVPFAIWPHFKDEDKEILEPLIKTVSYPMYILKDTQAILVENNNYTIVGEGDELIYNI